MDDPRCALVLVVLDEEQIAKAKAANGPRKRITHAIMCGPHGQIFGTEKQCRKYYDPWKRIFPELFSTAYETDNYPISDFRTTPELVMRLIEASDEAVRTGAYTEERYVEPRIVTVKPKNKGCGTVVPVLLVLIAGIIVAAIFVACGENDDERYERLGATATVNATEQAREQRYAGMRATATAIAPTLEAVAATVFDEMSPEEKWEQNISRMDLLEGYLDAVIETGMRRCDSEGMDALLDLRDTSYERADPKDAKRMIDEAFNLVITVEAGCE